MPTQTIAASAWPSAGALEQDAGHERLGHQVGRPEVQRELALEVLNRRLVHAPAGGEPAHQVDEAAQRRVRLCGTRVHHPRTESGSNRSAWISSRPVALLTPARARARRSTARPPASRSSSRRATTAAPSPPVPPVTIAVRSICRPQALYLRRTYASAGLFRRMRGRSGAARAGGRGRERGGTEASF